MPSSLTCYLDKCYHVSALDKLFCHHRRGLGDICKDFRSVSTLFFRHLSKYEKLNVFLNFIKMIRLHLPQNFAQCVQTNYF